MIVYTVKTKSGELVYVYDLGSHYVVTEPRTSAPWESFLKGALSVFSPAVPERRSARLVRKSLGMPGLVQDANMLAGDWAHVIGDLNRAVHRSRSPASDAG